ncbi:MAG: class I SAM-dependent methyltransferase [Rhodospirillales bacterium]|jgi:cyclopropane-fatty-acyl-phospholipid synthase|nr:class I SAM-dependent methyltransferase [Rhodospirillales bacterium]
MSLRAVAIALAERVRLPDAVMRAGIDLRVKQLARQLSAMDVHETRVIAALMEAQPIVADAAAPTAWFHALPEDFFGLMLGPRRKHSSGIYDQPTTTLAAAEERALQVAADHAGLADGQRVLDLGCGWGALSLWLAERFPNAEIVAVSNFPAHRAFILAEAARRGLSGVTALTGDISDFTPEGRFDRVVAISLFESIANWSALFGRIHGWLERDGILYLETLSHRQRPYQFRHAEGREWVARHFFAGGTMPSHGLVRAVDPPFTVEQDWRWNGTHFARTATDWLANFDAHQAAIAPLLVAAYGGAAPLWRRRWRLFLLAAAGLFGSRGGADWGVSQYRLRPRQGIVGHQVRQHADKDAGQSEA